MDVKVKIKQFDLDKPFKMPTQAYDSGSAGWDLYASSVEIDSDRNQIIYDLNLSVEFPSNYVMLIFPRSSIYKKNIRLCNSVGVGDSNYTGCYKAIFDVTEVMPELYKVGDAICQAIFIELPQVKWELTNDRLSNTARGEGGFGSSSQV